MLFLLLQQNMILKWEGGVKEKGCHCYLLIDFFFTDTCKFPDKCTRSTVLV